MHVYCKQTKAQIDQFSNSLINNEFIKNISPQVRFSRTLKQIPEPQSEGI